MRPSVRFVLGLGLGGSGLVGYLLLTGPEQVFQRATAVTLPIAVAVGALIVAEASADGIGVWASVRPLGGGLTRRKSVQFAFAGDFFDILSPAGPVTSEPIMARFYGIETGTSYSEALGVRGVAKYVKSGTQLLASVILVGILFVGGTAPQSFLTLLAGSVTLFLCLGVVLIYTRKRLSQVIVYVLTPIVSRLSTLYREKSHSKETVSNALDGLWNRALFFRDAPDLLVLIAVGGLLEQALTAGALWVALTGTGATVALLPIIAVIPLPQAASVVPIPASLGAYDVLLGGALALMTSAGATEAAAAVLVVRTFSLGIGVVAGGVATGFLRGWRP